MTQPAASPPTKHGADLIYARVLREQRGNATAGAQTVTTLKLEEAK